ncbi:MAG: glycosyltransferase family 2 protein [Stellaceae bacterium]
MTRKLARVLPHRVKPLIGVEDTSYGAWVARFDTLRGGDRAKIKSRIEAMTYRPLISVILPINNPSPVFLRRAVKSVVKQIYSTWELCVAADDSAAPALRQILDRYGAADPRIRVAYRAENGNISRAGNSALSLATGEFVALLDHDDELAPHALYMIAEELAAHADADLVYSDEDEVDTKGRRSSPYFKTDWNPDLFLAQNILSRLCAFRTSAVRQLGGFREDFEGSQDYDLALRVIERTEPRRIRHVPHVLYHRRAAPGSLVVAAKEHGGAAARRAVSDHFQRLGISAAVTAAPIGDYQRVKYRLRSPVPRVSIVVPTTDRLDLVERCVDGILHRTDYGNLEILIVDNRSVEEATLRYFARIAGNPRVRILPYDAPFNFSAINNFAARRATGEILVLLNNDTEVINADWLAEMAANAQRPEVGAVGAKLLYPNDTVQHGGVIVGVGGLADHASKNLPRSSPGYFGRAQLAQNFSAVTAACLALRKNVFDEVGGLNEADLRVAFNDVDLCLRIREKGYLVVWTPYAELYHHESATRGSDATPERRPEFEQEMRFLKEKWGKVLRDDPYYNPNLSLRRASFELAFPPRVAKPW